LTPQAIPDRSTSRYAGQYARAADPQRLLEIFTVSHKIALNSQNPATAHSRFEVAVEAYYQLMSMGLQSDLRSSVQDAMTALADQFTVQVCLNEALGLCAKASKLKTARRKLRYLQHAGDVLRSWLAQHPTGASAIRALLDTVLAEVAQIEAAADPLTSGP
jgi:hypothetical protein